MFDLTDPSLRFMLQLTLSASAEVGDADWLAAFLKWARAEGPGGLALLGFGLVAQVMFFTRWIVQWTASERRKESHIPVLFWWLSLLGATMLLTYFILRADPVGILGQSVGWIVYGRNLVLIRRNGRARMME